MEQENIGFEFPRTLTKGMLALSAMHLHQQEFFFSKFKIVTCSFPLQMKSPLFSEEPVV